MGNKVLVLGSDGQVGRYLVTYLREAGHSVSTFDFSDGKEFDLRISNNVTLSKKVEESDFVFFLAFDVGGSTYLKTYQKTYEFLENNVRIMNNTFEILRKTATPFVFSSSQMSTMTFSTYGCLKQLGEHYTRSLGGISVKFWNVYGYESDKSKFHVISDFILMALKGGTIRMATSGEEERDFLYAGDCSEALISIMENFTVLEKSQVLDIASFSWVKIIDIANIIAQKIPSTVERTFEEDLVQNSVKNEPSKDILDLWEPKSTASDGIDLVIEKMKRDLF